ncbi:MAG: alpha/beta hydrolase [Bdellovibrionales bacterium]|nr:alpha/beta hydrolase [Bdellovibrionales bacterium]
MSDDRYKTEFSSIFDKDSDSGFIEVPEDWSNPSGKRLKIFYYGRLKVGDGRIAPVIFVNGGPGLASGVWAKKVLKGVPENIPVLFFDQRGTGYSSPYPEVKNPKQYHVGQFYGASSISEDIEYLRKEVLGGAKVNVVGHSYGAKIAYSYLRKYSENLNSLHAISFALHEDPQKLMEYRYRGLQIASESYFKRFPEDRDIVRNLRKLIGHDFCFGGGCGSYLLDKAIKNLVLFPESWSDLHGRLSKLMVKGKVDWAYLREFLAEQKVDFRHNSNEVSPSEFLDFFEITGGDRVELARKRLLERGFKLPSETIDPYALESTDQRNIWPEESRLKEYLKTSDLARTLKEVSGIPIYIYKGASDSIVPMKAFESMQGLLGSKTVSIEVASRSHFDIIEESKVWDAVVSVGRCIRSIRP